MSLCRRARLGAALAAAALLASCSGDEHGGDATSGGVATDTADVADPSGAGTTTARAAAVDAIVLVTIDGARASELASWDADLDTTPRTAELARAGARFVDASSASPDPASALATLFTGLQPAAHGLVADPSAPRALHPALPRLPALLRDAGWATLAYVPEAAATAANPLALGLAEGFEQVRAAGGGPAAPLALAAERIAATEGGPAFLWVHVDALRGPLQPTAAAAKARGLSAADFARLEGPDASPELRDRARAAVLADVDGGLALVASALSASPAAERALLVVTGVAPTALEPRGELGALASVVRSRVATPLLVVGRPPVVRPGSAIPRPVGGADLAPTLAELAGLAPLADAQGHSFARDLAGELEWAAPVWVDSSAGAEPAAAVRWGSLELVAARDGAAGRRLHDLRADPGSTTDVSERHATEAALMATWMGRIDARCAALRERYPAVAPGF